MRTNLLKFCTLLCLLFVGIGNVWGDSYTIEFKSQASGTSDGSTKVTDTDDIIAKGSDYMTVSAASNIYCGKTGYGIKGGGSSAKGSITLNTTDAGKKKPSKITINACYYGSDAKKLVVYVNGATSGTTLDLTSELKDYVLNLDGNTELLTLKLEASTSNKARFYINSLIVTYNTSGGEVVEKTATTTTFNGEASYTITQGDDFTGPTATVTGGEGLAPTYSSSTPAVATVNAENGAVTIVGVGSTTITASYAGDDTYAASSASYTLTVNAPIVEYSSLQALVAADVTSGTTVKVSFEKVPIKSIFTSSQSKRTGIYFDIQKAGKDIEIYYSSEEVPETWVQTGTVSGTMTCPWTLYNGTWELAPAKDTWSWSNLTYVAPATQKTTPTLTLGTYQKTLTTGNDDEYTVTYNGDATVEVTSSDETVAEAIIVDGTVAISAKKAGTTTITVSAAETENYYAANKQYTLTVTDPAPAAELPFSFDGGKADIDSKVGMTQTGLSSDYSASPKLKFDSQGDNVIINYASTARNITYKLKGNSTTSATVFDVLESADGKTYTTVHSHTGTNVSSTATSYTDKLKADSRYVKFVYTTKGGNVALGAISITNEKADADLAFGQSTYRFFTTASDKAVAATSSKGSTGAITYALTTGDESAFLIDGNTGYIVCETAGTYTVTATIAETDDYKSGTAICNVQIKEPIVANSIIVAEADNGCYAMTNTAAGDYITSVAITKAGDKYYVNSDDIFESIKYATTTTTEGKTTIVALNGQYLQATAAKKVSFTDDEYQWSYDGEKLTASDDSHGTLQYNVSDPRFTTYTSKTGQYATIVSLDNVKVGSVVPVTLNKACTDGEMVYGTFSSSKPLYVPGDVVVAEVGIVDDALYVDEYKTGNIVPANTGVMVSALEGGTYYFEVADAETASLAESVLGDENSLRPSGDNGISYSEMESKDENCLFYRLTMHNGTQIGFWWGAADGDGFNLAANKAYLAVPKDTQVKADGLWFGNGETGLSNVMIENNNEAIYNVAGQRVSNATKGLYIKNGKKYLVK